MKTLLSGKTYDILKWLALLALPATADFIKFLFPTWNIPYGDPISETIRQVAFLIGILIGISQISYEKAQKISIEDFNKDGK